LQIRLETTSSSSAPQRLLRPVPAWLITSAVQDAFLPRFRWVAPTSASSLRVFQKVLKLTDGMLDVTVTKTSDDGATVAKSQEILRSYNDAASRVQSIATKLGLSVGK
jgi:hypothetical protein